MAELSNGEGFGEISLLMGIPTTSSVETLSDSTLLMLERDDFKSFVEKNASVEKRISKLIRNRLDQLGALNDIEASK